MKKICCRLFLFLLVVVFSYTATFEQVLAAKKNPTTTQTIKVYSNRGESTVYGSILNPKEDEINILLPKTLIEKIRKVGVDKLNCSITSKLDTTKTYSIPKDSIRIQKKKIGTIAGKYLVISLFNLTTPSGITVSPSSLPTDSYKIKILAEDIDLTTAAFSYKTPALVVGVVKSRVAALVTVEDLSGNQISDKTIAADQNGSFFTEVRANRISPQTKARKHLKAQTIGNDGGGSTGEDIDAGLVHAVADTDLYAITFLDPDKNDVVTDMDLVVDDNSTLTANLAMDNEDLAFEVANDQLQNLEDDDGNNNDNNSNNGGNSGNSNNVACNIDQFSPRCTPNSDLAPIGGDFKKFLETAQCDFPQFDLIRKIILASPVEQNALIGKAYCEHYTRESNDDKPCQVYNQILSDYKAGKITDLPCPPQFCKEFQNKPIKCSGGGGFCEDGNTTNNCIHRAIKDLYCARIGVDVKPEECRDDKNHPGFSPGWIQETDNEGNKYCVPSNIPKPQFPAGYTGPQPPSTSKEIANECKLNSCHKTCSEKYPYTNYNYGPDLSYPSKCEQCDCHRQCDAEAGKLIECNDRDQYFSKRCCERGPGNVFFQVLAGQTHGGSGNPGFGKGPIGINVFDCLCKDTINNFNEKGYVKPEAQKTCLENCPQDYEKDVNSNQCLPICDKEKGFVRDPGGTCRKKCPEGSFDDGTGNCKCQEGQTIGPSGKCEGCPAYCKNSNLPTFTATLPPECQKCNNGGPATCSGNMLPNSNHNGEAQCICPPGLPYWNINQCVAACPNGPPSPNSSYNLPPKSPIPCNEGGGNQCGNSNMRPNPSYTPGSNQAQCICPDDQPYWYQPSGGAIGSCVATCPNGNPPASASANMPVKSPIPCNSSTTTQCQSPYVTNQNGNPPCKCPDSTPVSFGSTCVAKCPEGLTAGYPQTYGNASGSNYTPMQTCLCPDKSYPDQNGKCYGGSNYCSPGISTSTGCTCNPSGGTYNATGYCTCPTNSGPYTKETGCSSATRPCTAGEGPSNGCYCFGNGYVGSDGKCQCANGVQYTGGGCGQITSNYCSPGISTSTGCTCNPSGGTYNATGYCTCPTNSGPYTKEYGCTSSSQCPTTTPYKCSDGTCAISQTSCPSSCPASTPYKCPNGNCVTSSTACSSTTNCPSPYVINPAYNSSNPNGVPPCKCADGKYSYNNDCVATCPSSLVTGTPSSGCGAGPIPSCLCSGNLQCPGANGQCGTSTTSHVCAAGEAATQANPCYCANGGTFSGPSGTGTCQCPNNNSPPYTGAGCGSSTTQNCPSPYVTNPSGTPPCKCPDATPIINGSTCVAACPSPLTSQSGPSGQQTCLCSGGVAPNANGTCPQQCTGGQIFDSSTNSCRCQNNQVLTNGTCQCPAGQQVDPNNSNNCIASPTINLTSASITGNNLTLSYAKSGFNECALIVGSSGNISHNGVNSYGLLCSQSGGTVTNSLSSFNNISPGSQIKVCKGNGTDTNTNTNLFTPNLCSSLVTVTTSDTITLTNVVRASNGDLTVTYSKSFADCVGLRQNNISGLRVTSQNQFCGTSGTQNVSAADLRSTVQVGTQVALCNDVSGFCSSPVAISGQ